MDHDTLDLAQVMATDAMLAVQDPVCVCTVDGVYAGAVEIDPAYQSLSARHGADKGE